MKKTLIWALALLVFAPLPGRGSTRPAQPAPDTPEAFVCRLQGLLQKKDFESYLAAFVPEARSGEKDRLDMFFDNFKMETVKLRLAGKKTEEDGTTRLFLQAYFQNAHSAMIETWILGAGKKDEGWTVLSRQVSGSLNTLYRLRVPSGRSERARRVEIHHQDIRLVFDGAAVFYDNLPSTDTALVVIGRGTVRFSPSDANERHQMELLFKKRLLEDEIDSVYVRCSNSFFGSNIRIEGSAAEPAVTPAEEQKAAAVFARDYPRSFTIENSIDKEILSFLPQGDEAVFEFRTRKSGELTYIYYPFSDDAVNLYDRGRDRILSLYNPEAAESPPAKRLFISFEEKYDIQHYGLDVSYSPVQSFLSAKARIQMTPQVDSLDSLKFRFSPELEILKIHDEDKRELFYTQDKLRKILYVYFLTPPAQGRPTWIEVFYRGRMSPPPPTTDVVAQAYVSNKLIFKPRYETYLFTQAGHWYPAPSEEDYFTSRLKVVVPPEYKCVANGTMVERGRWNGMDDVVEIEKTGNAVYTFETAKPIKSISFIIGKFERQKEASEAVPLQTLVSSEVPDTLPQNFDQARDILEYYATSFGPFPYEKLSIVHRLWPTTGGHSPASFIVLNQIPWLGERGFPVTLDGPVNLSDWEEYFLAHEIAHQWWGQAISFATYRDQWISEGLSQFAAASYLRKKYGERAFASILKRFAQWTEKKSSRGPITMGSRLSYFDFDAYQAIIYNKTASVLFMLQDLLGRDVFLSGLRAFFESHKYTAARTADFVKSLEKASGRDLKAFFQGWFYAYELPEVRTAWTETSGPGGTKLAIRVVQTNGRFVFPLWIEWTGRDGTRRELVVVDEAEKEFVLTLPEKPSKIRVNPDRAVPGRFS